MDKNHIMIQENELITLIFCVVTLAFLLINYGKLKKLPLLRVFTISYILFSIGWLFTVLEGLVFESIFNILEHLCYVTSAILLFIWIVIVFYKKEEKSESNRIN